VLTEQELAAAYDGRHVCVTGGAGFIGSHLVDALVARGAEVCVIDDLSFGRTSNLAGVDDRIRLVRGSILDRDAIAGAVGGASIVFHLAAMPSVPRSVEDPVSSFEVNAVGALRVLEAARQAGVSRVIYAASSSAYGDQPGLPRVETMAPDVRSPYAAVKCAGEYLMRAYAHCYDLSSVSLRYFNIFGPRQRRDSPYAAVMPRFVHALMSGEEPVVFGDGSQTRDFTHVSNAVRANLLAGAVDGPLRGEVVNIACGERTALLDIVERMASILGVEPRFRFAPPRVGEVQHSLASVEAARALFGYEPVTTLDDGLAQTVAWYRDRYEDA
jgi:UDP-glucose 4-epimerase